MSSRRSRSGGTRIGITLRRKYRSSRKVPFSISASRSLFVAAMARTSTLMVRADPRRSTSPSCSTRSTLACVLADISPTSSRKIVPRSACSNLPICFSVAPVSEPFSCPKSSDSINSSGIAAQFTWTNGCRLRRLLRWIDRATSSLPTPLSPSSRTVALVGAARLMASQIWRSEPLSPTIWCRASAARFSERFSFSSCVVFSALRIVTRTRSLASGFSMKSNAPSLVASTAVLTVPCPEMMTTGSDSVTWRIFCSVSRPSMPPILMSRNARSGVSRSMSARASAPLDASCTSYPSYSRIIRTERRISASSSTTRIRDFISGRGASPRRTPLHVRSRGPHAPLLSRGSLAAARSLSSSIHCRQHDAALPYGRIVAVERQRITGMGRREEPIEVRHRSHGLPVDLHDHEATPHAGHEGGAGGIHARDTHALDRRRDVHPEPEHAAQRTPSQYERPIHRLGTRRTRRARAAQPLVGCADVGRTLHQLHLRRLPMPVAQHVEARRRPGLTPGDVADQLFVGPDLAAVHRQDDVVRLQPGARRRRIVVDVLHQRAARDRQLQRTLEIRRHVGEDDPDESARHAPARLELRQDRDRLVDRDREADVGRP